MERRVFEEEEVHQLVEEDAYRPEEISPKVVEEEKKGEEESKLSKEFVNVEDQMVQKDKQISTFEDDLSMDFSVSNPDDKNGYVEYTCKGKDRQGEWEGNRRYTHFFLLHEVLTQRWPGLYLPRLPPKKAIGRYETKFLQQRRYGLERYMRKLGKYDFIINSEEFIVFSRPNGDPEKLLAKLTKIPYSQIIERMQRYLHINENLDVSDKEAYAGKIKDFSLFATRTLP